MSQNERGNKYALAALKKERGRRAGEIVELKKKLNWAEEQLRHVDATLVLLDPNIKASKLPIIRPQKRIKLFRQGELVGMIMDALRENGALTTKDIVSAVLKTGGHDEAARPSMTPRVRGSLCYLRSRDRIEQVRKGTNPLWKLSDDVDADPDDEP